ncbi:MAG: hypothetical protein Q7K43_00635 [Candidatus Woesearchaeota archaeon]|nr:hypothetical protein [Candidatus Woesearchaeota archaeon]
MANQIPPVIYHRTNSAVLAQIAKQQCKVLAPKLSLIVQGIYPLGGSAVPELILPQISPIEQCDWSQVSFSADQYIGAERELDRNSLKNPDKCENHLRSQRAWLDDGRKDGAIYVKSLAEALPIMDSYHKGLVDVLKKMSATELLELSLSIPIVLGFETKKIGDCFTKHAPRKTFFCAAPVPLDLVTELYCIDSPKVMVILEELGLKKYLRTIN